MDTIESLLAAQPVPYSSEAEQSVLGSILIDPSCMDIVGTLLRSEYFFIPEHQAIYSALVSMCDNSKSIDFVTLLEKLKDDGVYDDAAGKEYLTRLVNFVPSPKNVATYACIVKERYYVRCLINAANDILDDVKKDMSDSSKLLDRAEQRIFEIRNGAEVEGLVHIKSVIENETYDRLNKINNPETRNDYIGIPTGIGDLDRMITGLNKSDLIILGARPGMGKTSFALNIARHAAMVAGKTVCVFSLEMSRDQLAQRLISSEAVIDSNKLRTGNLDDDEWTRLAQAGKHLSTCNMYIDETSGITVSQMRAKIRQLSRKCHVDLVIIDYLGLMHSSKKIENRVQEIGDITGSLKIMAKDLKIPVLCCAQLSRKTEEKGKSHKPSLSDLRDSGSIEQDADIVMFLYRDAYYDNEKKADEEKSDVTEASLLVAKNRHGAVGEIKLHWDGAHTRYTSVENNYE